MLPKAIKEYKNRAAILIQKHMRGYSVAVKHYTDHRRWILEKHDRFFSQIRTDLERNALSIIARCVRRYMVRKSLLAAEQFMLEQEKNKKKSKKKVSSKGKKKKPTVSVVTSLSRTLAVKPPSKGSTRDSIDVRK
jgi:hypothetical protein